MKINTDFITNSSCASFIISKYYLSDYQIELIKDHINQARNYTTAHRGPNSNLYDSPYDEWKIIETETEIQGDTVMDNFDMLWFLLQIGVDEDQIKMEGCY